MIYHCVSSPVSWYIMSLVDTWYIAISSFFSLLVISCRYHVAFLMIHGHDTDTWYIDDIWWYIAKFKYHTPRRPPYMISNDITWYHPPRPQPKPPDHKLWYHDISCDIMKHDITWYIMIHHDTRIQAHRDDIEWYMMIFDDDNRVLDSSSSSSLSSSLSESSSWIVRAIFESFRHTRWLSAARSACVPATRYDVIGYCVRCSPRLSCTKPKVRHG